MTIKILMFYEIQHSEKHYIVKIFLSMMLVISHGYFSAMILYLSSQSCLWSGFFCNYFEKTKIKIKSISNLYTFFWFFETKYVDSDFICCLKGNTYTMNVVNELINRFCSCIHGILSKFI